jgi:hypothetical protein
VFVTSPNIMHPEVTDPIIRALLYPDMALNADLEAFKEVVTAIETEMGNTPVLPIPERRMISPFAYSGQGHVLSKKHFNHSVSNLEKVYTLNKPKRKKSANRASSAVQR